MTKIYEALQIAGKERGGTENKGLIIPARVRLSLPEAIEDKLLSLNRRIELLLELRQGRIVEFTGAQAGHDASRLAFEFAKLTARRLNRRVLLLVAGPFPFVRTSLPVSGGSTWEDAIQGGRPIDEYIQPIGDTGVSVSQMSPSPLALSSVMAKPGFDIIMSSLRSRFDLILLDAPPLCESSSASRLASMADGVILVVEAGKTRWQVIKHQIEQVTANKGQVLGVILNKRRYYIPDFIYKRL